MVFEIRISQGVIPKSPRFYQRVEGSPVAHSVVAGDPSLRLKNGYAQDDAVDGRRCHQKFKMSHYRKKGTPLRCPAREGGRNVVWLEFGLGRTFRDGFVEKLFHLLGCFAGQFGLLLAEFALLLSQLALFLSECALLVTELRLLLARL